MNENIGVTESKGYKVFSVVRTIFVYLLALLIIIAAMLFAADKSPNKSMFGYRYYTVLTDSMVPEFYSGDMVFVKLSNADSINTGDVITFNPSSGSDAYLTHRVTEKIDDYQGSGVTCFRTKGDANDSEDSFLIDEERVIGKVQFHVPKMGIIVRFVQLRWYFIVPLIVLLIIFFKLMKYYFTLHGENSGGEPAETNEKLRMEE
ncbi:MAG: signal peptidase I [Ruminococcus sp.]|nr:signal peptidase I [Ruminococcus sp.]